jgi:hypothetical protein
LDISLARCLGAVFNDINDRKIRAYQSSSDDSPTSSSKARTRPGRQSENDDLDSFSKMEESGPKNQRRLEKKPGIG